MFSLLLIALAGVQAHDTPGPDAAVKAPPTAPGVVVPQQGPYVTPAWKGGRQTESGPTRVVPLPNDGSLEHGVTMESGLPVDYATTPGAIPSGGPFAEIGGAATGLPVAASATVHLTIPNRAIVTIDGYRATKSTWSRYRDFRIVGLSPTQERAVKIKVQIRDDSEECYYRAEECDCGVKFHCCCRTVYLRAGDDIYVDMRRKASTFADLPPLSFDPREGNPFGDDAAQNTSTVNAAEALPPATPADQN